MLHVHQGALISEQNQQLPVSFSLSPLIDLRGGSEAPAGMAPQSPASDLPPVTTTQKKQSAVTRAPAPAAARPASAPAKAGRPPAVPASASSAVPAAAATDHQRYLGEGGDPAVMLAAGMPDGHCLPRSECTGLKPQPWSVPAAASAISPSTWAHVMTAKFSICYHDQSSYYMSVLVVGGGGKRHRIRFVVWDTGANMLIMTASVAEALGIEYDGGAQSVTTAAGPALTSLGQSKHPAHLVLAPESAAEVELRDGLPHWCIASDNKAYQVLLGMPVFVRLMAGLYPCLNQLVYWPRGLSAAGDFSVMYALPVVAMVPLPEAVRAMPVIKAAGAAPPRPGRALHWQELLALEPAATLAHDGGVDDSTVMVLGIRYSLQQLVDVLSDGQPATGPGSFTMPGNGVDVVPPTVHHDRVRRPYVPKAYVQEMLRLAPVTPDSLRLAAALARMWQSMFYGSHTQLQVGLLRLQQRRWRGPHSVEPHGHDAGQDSRVEPSQMLAPGVFPVPDWSAPFPGAYDYCGLLALAACYEPMSAGVSVADMARNEVVTSVLLYYTALVHEHVATQLAARGAGPGQPEGLQNPATLSSSTAGTMGSAQEKGRGKGKGKSKGKGGR